MRHGRGTPDTEVGRSLTAAAGEAHRAQPGGWPTRPAGPPTAARESDPPLGLGGRASRRRGEGADRQTQPAQDPWTGQDGSAKPGTPPGRVEQRRPSAKGRSGSATSMGGSPRRGSRTAGVISAQRPATASMRGAPRPTSRTWTGTSATWSSNCRGSVTEPHGSDGALSPTGTATSGRWGERPLRINGCRGRSRVSSPPSTRRISGAVAMGIGHTLGPWRRWTTGRSRGHGGETTGWSKRTSQAAATPARRRG